MELDITSFLHTADPFEFSASYAERGINAGPKTWGNAKREASTSPLITEPGHLELVRDWFGEFGAWDEEQRTAWSADDINALLIQFISGDIREAESLCPGDDETGIDWDEYRLLSEQGSVSGRMYQGDSDGRVYFYIGS